QSRLYARSFIVCDLNSDKRVVILTADIWSCTQAVKMEVVKRLKTNYGNELYTLDNVLLSGTHTHSGPGGYSHYALYNLTILGFDEQNFECIVNGMVESIKMAHENLAPGKIFINRGRIDQCGRNRSPEAYKKNPEIERIDYGSDTDKEMLLIKFVKEDGSIIGCLNWYAIHPTNRGNKNQLITGDNKGYASYLFEKEMESGSSGNDHFIAAFANSNCGDVSGNVRFGVPDLTHDFLHMQEFGKKQCDKAKELFDSADEQLTGEIDYRHSHIDMSNVNIETTGEKTYPATLGASMFAGSTEDSESEFGISEGITATSTGDFPFHQRHVILQAITLLSGLLSGFEFPGLLDDDLKKGHGNKPIVFAQGLSKPFPLSPEILPIQIIRIGNLVLTAIPSEITTMAGRRLKKTVLDILKNSGVDSLALFTYANAYAGYITTKEEYDIQHYEGASTHFGPYTLNAYQQEFGKLATAMRDGLQVDSGPTPRDLSDKQTNLQTGIVFDTQPWPWTDFGEVETDAELFYKPGTTAKVVFWGAHPKNDLRTKNTFLQVQKKEGNTWKTIFTDKEPCTIYKWNRDFVANSKITITWNIPENTEPGEYRICHYGNSKNLSGEISSYEGKSRTFNVRETILSTEVEFNNLFPKQVELWFYSPDDSLRWIAHSMHKVNSQKKYSWALPSGWNSAQVWFTGPGKWYTVSAGEIIIINKDGAIDHFFPQ
ncbi:MAG: neutral/alkaline non-lysosomal ceramidase N-terminal domain-containing protein, partial [Ignavibacteria bacterium]|nr:neutral/alkaline non-lysosomal ceramidase N-terminal domain-containing protein [Ignavibacteria bacterium]